jgi:hypothetical protein
MATGGATKFSSKCAVPLCATKGSSGFHIFPSNPIQREKWLKLCQLPEAKPVQRVCKIHFESSDYYDGDKMPRLKRGVVPSLFMPPVPSIHSVSYNEEPMDQIECLSSPVTKINPDGV